MNLLIKSTILFFSFSLFLNTFSVASSASDIRKFDLLSQEKNLKITKSTPLKIPGIFEQTHFNQKIKTILSYKQLLELDTQLRQKDFANNYLADGCYAKSHLISYELNRVGIESSKVLISGAEIGDLRVLQNNRPALLFQFHISPLVLVEVNNQIKYYVLDLSFFDHPVELEAWVTYFYKNANLDVVKTAIVNNNVISPDWTQSESSMYADDLLYRFETEIDAFKFILKTNSDRIAI